MNNQKPAVGPLGLGILAVMLVVGGLVFFLAKSTNQTQMTTLQRIRADGVVRIGFANEAPYGYLDSATGTITGEAPEIARVVLGRMGIERIKPVLIEFGSLIPGLKAGRFDLIAAGMYVTPQRAEEINFSNPTYAVGEAFLVAQGNPLSLHSFEDVAEHEEARIGVMGGAVEHKYAKRVGVPHERIVVFPDYPSAVEGLKTDRVDAVAATVLTADDLLRKAGEAGIERAEPFTDPDIDGRTVNYGAFGFRKAETDESFRQEFNRQLADFIGTPEHLNLVRPFGFSEDTLPGDVTTDEIIDTQL